MCLEIELDGSSDEQCFTSGGSVTGHVLYHNRKLQRVQQVTIYLEGTLKQSIKQLDQYGSRAKTTRTLLSRWQTVFHDDPDQISDEKVKQQNHRHRFELGIPLTIPGSTSSKSRVDGRETTLPPSLHVCSSTIDVEIAYRLRAVVTRSGAMSRDIVAVRTIEIQPLQPPNPFEDLIDNTRLWRRLSQDSNSTSALKDNKYMTKSCSDSLSLEVASRSTQVLHAGRPLNIDITMRISKQDRPILLPLWLTSLSFRLKVRTTATDERNSATNEAYFTLWSYSGFLPLLPDPESECFIVPNSLWKDSIFPSVTPSFDCCGVSRSYELQVLAVISPSSKGTIWKYAVGTDVAVRSEVAAPLESPPSYAP